MAKFRFALQAVLNQRARAEQERLVAVAELERQRIEIEGQLRELQGRIEYERSELQGGLGAGFGGQGAMVNVGAIRMQAAASLHAVADAQKLVFRLAGVHQRTKLARARLAEATAARKAMELLKERRYQEWLSEANRREDRLLDDIGIAAAVRSGERLNGWTDVDAQADEEER